MKGSAFLILVLFFSLCYFATATAQVSNVKAAWQADRSVLITWTFSGETTVFNKLTQKAEPLMIAILKSTVLDGSGNPIGYTIVGEVPAASTGSFQDTNLEVLLTSLVYKVSSGKETSPQTASPGTKAVEDLAGTDPTNTVGTTPDLGPLRTRTETCDAPSELAPTSDPATQNPYVYPILKATAGDGQVTLTWQPLLFVLFRVKSATSSNGPFNEILWGIPGTIFTYTVTGLPNGKPQYFVISWYFDNGMYESPNSSPVCAIPQAPN